MKHVFRIRETSDDGNLPSVKEVCSSEEIAEKNLILSYFDRFRPTAESPTMFFDVVAEKRTCVNLKCYSDGEFVWRNDEVFYFKKYNIPISEEFVNKVKSEEYYNEPKPADAQEYDRYHIRMYDEVTDEEREKMKEIKAELLKLLNIPDPDDE